MIFTEDVEKIFGKRPWVSRTDEILAAKAVASNDGSGQTDASDFVEVEATEIATDDTDKSDKPSEDVSEKSDKTDKTDKAAGQH